MKRKWKFLIAIFIIFQLSSCLISDGKRYCRDGSITFSSGRGTCSWHGGKGAQPEKRVLWWIFVSSVGLWAYVSFKNSFNPQCPKCKSQMVLHTEKNKIKYKGKKYWGCSKYPRCKGWSEHI